MSTYTQICYHIVFSTKERVPALKADRREELFRYIWGILKNRDCHLYRINGTEDHLHILTSLHPTVNLAGLIKEVKTGSSLWIKENSVFGNFSNWQDGYGAFTHSKGQIGALIEYVKGQVEHHHRTTFAEEYRKLLVEAGIEFDERYIL
ncbi:MAG: IS200/IS605 family transposase [Terriglobia bacterium]|jgi:REP element-mobilizing transposase RayT